jgi:hypothetical protein
MLRKAGGDERIFPEKIQRLEPEKRALFF